MTKALRMMEDNLRLVDALIYVIDSRAVYSCNNPLFDRLIAGKRCFTFSTNATSWRNPTLTVGAKSSSATANRLSKP